MIQIELNYEGQVIIIQCNEKEKIKNIHTKFCTKTKLDEKNIFFIYDGSIINEELDIESVMNQLDKTRKRINIIVGFKNRQINGKKI